MFGFEYNPFTLLLKHPRRKAEPRDPPRKGSFVDFHRSKVHELNHWIAFNSTSIGNLLSLMLFTRARTVLNLLWGRSQKVRQAVVTARYKHGKPLVLLHETGNLLSENFINNPKDLHSLCQIWHDHLVVFNMLYSSNLQDEIDLPRGMVLGEVMGDAILYATEEVGLSSNPGTAIARVLYAQESTPFLRHTGERLTTKLVFEALALANEMMSIRSFTDASEVGIEGCELKSHIEELSGEQGILGSYGLAIRMIWDIAGIVGLETVCPAIYLALNPPVPPVVFLEKPVDWHDLYPPIRLSRIAQAIPKVGTLQPFATPKVLREFISKLADAAGLDDPNEFAAPAGEISERLKCFDSIGPDWKEPDTPTDYYRFLLWTQHSMWAQRDRAMPLLVNVGGCMYGPQSGKHAQELFNFDGEGAWLHPRILWTENDKLGHDGNTVSFGSWLMTSQAAHYYLDDFVSAKGPFDFSPYPPAVRSFLADRIEEHHTRMLVSPPSAKQRRG